MLYDGSQSMKAKSHHFKLNMTKDKQMTNDIGTLAGLGVKEGDVVEHLYFFDGDAGCYKFPFKVDSRGRAIDKSGCFFLPKSLSTFRIISRADNPPKPAIGLYSLLTEGQKKMATTSQEPKTWGQMTDEEKGALLLAKHEGKVIEAYWDGKWVKASGPNYFRFSSVYSYRIKPEPVIETVVMYASDKMKGFGLCRGDKSVHKLTFKTFDGEIDYTTVKMSKL